MNTALEKQLASLVKFLTATKTKYAVLGGVAVALYGEPRLTLDIDVNISIDRDNIDCFLEVGKRYGFYPIPRNIKTFIKKTGVIPMRFIKGKIVGQCDIIIAENIIERLALERARMKKIGLVRAMVITPEDLIIHKITSSRSRDIEDLRGILNRQKGKLNLRYIQYWLGKIDKASQKTQLLRLFKNLLVQIK